jgi:hypothetical protein
VAACAQEHRSSRIDKSREWVMIVKAIGVRLSEDDARTWGAALVHSSRNSTEAAVSSILRATFFLAVLRSFSRPSSPRRQGTFCIPTAITSRLLGLSRTWGRPHFVGQEGDCRERSSQPPSRTSLAPVGFGFHYRTGQGRLVTLFCLLSG